MLISCYDDMRTWWHHDVATGFYNDETETMSWYEGMTTWSDMIVWRFHDMIIWWSDDTMIWCEYDYMTIWCHDVMMSWWCTIYYIWYDGMMIWWYDGVMMWWYDDMLIWWCDDMMVWSPMMSSYDDLMTDGMMIRWIDDMMIWWYQPAAAWQRIGSLRIFCLCVNSFVAPLWVPLDLLFLSLGRLRTPMNPFGQPVGHFGTPWHAMVVALVCRGTFSSFGTKLDANSEQMALKYAACAEKVASRNYLPDPRDRREVWLGAQLRIPVDSRRGRGWR